MSRCDICLDKDCKHKECHCSTCANADKCPKFLHPTIRITTKCTQSCGHCCFSCSPTCNKMMEMETADNIAKYLKNNDIYSINVMGGEFFLNPNWFYILNAFLSTGCHMRLVSNSDWYNNDDVKRGLIELKRLYNNQFYLSLSNDRWHTNVGVKKVAKFLDIENIHYIIETEEQGSSKSIVPLGRSEGDCSFYGLFACYCHNPMNQYSFLIDEEGTIYKCPFGVLSYDNISNFLDGGFAARFKEFNMKFYDIWISSCSQCIRSTRGMHSN